MNWAENKFEMSVILAMALLLSAMFFAFRTTSHRGFVTQEIVYEMPRPESFTPGEYDLSQREIDRRYNNPFEKIPANSALGKRARATTPTKAKSKAKVAAKKSTDKTKKNNSGYRVVEGKTSGLTPSEVESAHTNTQGNLLDPQKKSNPKNQVNGQEDNEKDQRGRDQWRALLQAQPTFDNMRKLVVAYNEKQIDSESFYEIISGLMENQNADTQSVGLYGAEAAPSEKSFIVISDHYELLSGKSKKYADEILLGYNHVQRIGWLNLVLANGDEKSVLRAGEVILRGLEKYKSGESLDSGARSFRGDSRIKSLSQYAILVPTLQKLLQSGSASLAQVANSVLSQIQTQSPAQAS